MKQEIEEMANEAFPSGTTSPKYYQSAQKHKQIGFIAGYSQAMEQPKWVSVEDGLPKDSEIYDIVCWWKDSHKQEERKGYIFKSKHLAVDWINFFQHKGFYDNGLYEESFGLDENIITHYRLHDPLPTPPNQTK